MQDNTKFLASVHNLRKSSSHNRVLTSCSAVPCPIPCLPKNAQAALMRGDPSKVVLSTHPASTHAFAHSKTWRERAGFFCIVDESRPWTRGNSCCSDSFSCPRRMGDRPMVVVIRHRSGNSVKKDKAAKPLPTEDNASTVDLKPAWN